MTRKAPHIHPADWGDATGLWKGHVEGHDLDTGVTVLFFSTEKVGRGPLETTDIHLNDRWIQTDLSDPELE